MTDRTDHVIDSIDRCLSDYAVSPDAMRWRPDKPFKPRLGDPGVWVVHYGPLQPHIRDVGLVAVEQFGHRASEALAPLVEWARAAAEAAGLSLQRWQAAILPAYRCRRTDPALYLDGVDPCPHCAAAGGIETTAPGRPGEPWRVTCQSCRGQWAAVIEDWP